MLRSYTPTVLVTLSLFSLGCHSAHDTDPSTLEPAAAEHEAAVPAPAAVSSPATDLPDTSAYFLVDGQGIVGLDERGWRTVFAYDGPIRFFLPAPDRRHYLVTPNNRLGQLTEDGSEVIDVPPLHGTAMLWRYSVDTSGRLWGYSRESSRGGVAMFDVDSGAWQEFSAATITGHEAGEIDNLLTVAADGTVWTSGRVRVSDSEVWTERYDQESFWFGHGQSWAPVDYRDQLTSYPGLGTLVSSPRGAVLYQSSDGVFTLRPDGMKRLSCPDLPMAAGSLALSDSGELAYLVDQQWDRGCQVARFDPDTPETCTLDPEPFPCLGVGVRDLDDRGRIWVMSAMGLNVVTGGAGPDAQLRHYPTGSVTELFGSVTAIHVSGAGPTLPPLPSTPVEPSTLTGAVTRNGAPAVGVTVTVCYSIRSTWGMVPAGPDPLCPTDALGFAQTRTDSEGRYRLEGLTIADYYIVLDMGQPGEDAFWRGTSVHMRPGETYEVDTWSLD